MLENANANANVNVNVDGDVNWNLEQTENEIQQQKWNILGNATKKSLISSSIYNSNYDRNDNTLNGFQSVENPNGMVSMRGSTNDVNDDDDDNASNGGGAAALQPTIETDEKSISIKNRFNANLRTATMAEVRSTRYTQQTNIINESSRTYTDDRQCHHSNTLFESVQPMKTQRKTTGE